MKSFFTLDWLLFQRRTVRLGSWAAFLTTLLIVWVALLLRVSVSRWLEGVEFITFFPAVIFASFLFGTAAGLFAVVLSATATILFIMPAPFSFRQMDAAGAFMLVAILEVAIISALRSAAMRVGRLNVILLSKEEKFRSVMDSTPDSMLIVTPNGCITEINGPTETLFGYPREELIGQPYDILIPERYRSEHAAHHREFLDHPRARPMGFGKDLSARRKDGTQVPVEIGLVPFQAAGELFISVGVRDVTERRSAERALRENELRYRLLADNTTDLIVLQKADGSPEYVSPACRRMLGYEPGEMSRLTVEALVHPEDMAGFTGARGALSRDQPVATSTHRIRRNDGSFAWVEGVYHWINGGPEPQIMSVLRDISERKTAESRLIDAIEASEDGVALYDSQDRLVLLNKALRHNPAGRTDLFVPGRTYEEIVRAYWQDSELAMDKETFDRFVAREVERHRKGDGTRSELRVGDRTWLVDRNFRTRDGGILYLSTDVSALKLAKEEAEKANLSKSRFLAAASHDLRQPLQSIALLQGILRTIVQDTRSQSLVEKLDMSLHAMSDMLDTLLEVNQLEAGVVTPVIEDFPIGEMLSRILAELRYHAEAKGLDLRSVECSSIVRSDPKLLEHVIRNLLSNAIKYTNRGKILLGCRHRGSTLRISVLDTGIGIAGDQIDAIFEEFHQVDNPARDRQRGLGLGLSIVQRLSSLLDLHIDVRSMLHKGSAFSVEVPLGAASNVARPSPSPLPHTALPMDILLVENDSMVSETLQTLLEFQGHRVVGVTDAEAALARLAKADWRPDVIVSDFNLPGEMNGLALIEQARQQLRALTPAILLTGDITLTNDSTSAMPLCTLLRKPADMEAINTALLVFCNAVPLGRPRLDGL